jgi:hypothetical protein
MEAFEMWSDESGGGPAVPNKQLAVTNAQSPRKRWVGSSWYSPVKEEQNCRDGTGGRGDNSILKYFV